MNMLSFLHAKGGQGDKLVVLMDGASSLASYRHFTAFTLASNGSKSGVSNSILFFLTDHQNIFQFKTMAKQAILRKKQSAILRQ